MIKETMARLIENVTRKISAPNSTLFQVINAKTIVCILCTKLLARRTQRLQRLVYDLRREWRQLKVRRVAYFPKLIQTFCAASFESISLDQQIDYVRSLQDRKSTRLNSSHRT